MRITRIALRNYRVYEELDLEVPPGVVGIYGPNGAGKSTILEAIAFSLYGKARTDNKDVRTTGVNAECLSEVEFEHEGHLYAVRRTISGVRSTVKASAFADRAQVAEGVTDTTKYVRSILGMDDNAFRASVFAEQKQLAAFSDHKPEERRKLVLQLLGITPIDRARDRVRADSRSAKDLHDRQRGLLPDLDAVRAEKEAAAALAAETTKALAQARAAEATAREQRERADAARTRVEEQARRYRELVDEGKRTAKERDDAHARAETLAKELAALEEAEAALTTLVPLAERVPVLEQRARGVDVVRHARAALAKLPLVEPLPAPDAEPATKLRASVSDARASLAEIDGELKAAQGEVDRARKAAANTAQLTPGEACPMCGQELGDAFERVRAHHAEELESATARQSVLSVERARREAELKRLTAEATAAERALAEAQRGFAVAEEARSQHQAAEAALQAALAAIEPPLADGEAEALAAQLESAQAAARKVAHTNGLLERRPAAMGEMREATARRDQAEAHRTALLAEVKALEFDPEAATAAVVAAEAAADGHEQARTAAHAAAIEAERTGTAAEAQARRLTEAVEQHAKLAEQAETARHLARAADLLSSFRNTLVAAVGPRLEAHASELFGQLTDNEYQGIELDRETYEIGVRDGSTVHGMDRYSGSETDLANLALRIAISEHVRFMAGGQVGLFVLDEVFGSLDQDRRDRMLSVLEALKGRFRQILVVTHDAEIKDQLPQAIEVVKLGERRATARALV